MLIIRYWLELKWLKAKKYIHKAETIWSAGMLKPMIIELIITTIGPQIFLKDMTYSEYVFNYDVTVVYPINNVLCCFVWVKLYVIIRTILLTNKYTTPRAQRVCLLNGCYADLIFSFRAKFKESPNSILIITFFLSSLMYAYMLRIFERPLSDVSGQNFNEIWTAVWCVFVTMTTVGYGDVYPKSYGGRILGASMCLLGVLLVSLFVATISEALEFTNLESNSFILIKRLVYREELRKSAAKVISAMYKLKLLTRHLGKRMSGNPYLDSRSDQRTLENADFRFKRTLLEFRKKSLEKRQFVFKHVDNIKEDLDEIKEIQDAVKLKQVKIFACLKLLSDIDQHMYEKNPDNDDFEDSPISRPANSKKNDFGWEDPKYNDKVVSYQTSKNTTGQYSPS